MRANYNNIAIGIFEDRTYLIKSLRNLLLGETNILQNRDLHISTISFNNFITSREFIILRAIKDNPKITTEQLSKEIGVSLRTVKSILKVMEDNKQIRRVNGKRYGYWKII